MRQSSPPPKQLGLPNLGPVSERWLLGIGVRGLDDLRALGAVEAYQRIRAREGRAATLNLLYALHAALEGKRWSEVTAAEKARLKQALD